MATEVTAPAGVDGRELSETIRVLVPEPNIRQDVRAATIVWRRELIRFRSDRLRVITGLIQPVLFLFVLGTGLSALASHGLPAGVDFKTFIYPGVLAMSVLFTAIFSAASIVWDREFGFLREMLVMPLFFLSGALYPLSGLPAWLAVLTRFDPLTYIVDPMRQAVFAHLAFGQVLNRLSPGITWFGWQVPLGLSLGIVAAMGLGMLGIAIAEFRKTE